MRKHSDGAFVLAADAEAHEKAAVELAVLKCDHERMFSIHKAREQAIRDCIAAVEQLQPYYVGTQMHARQEVEAALRALLEQP